MHYCVSVILAISSNLFCPRKRTNVVPALELGGMFLLLCDFTRGVNYSKKSRTLFLKSQKKIQKVKRKIKNSKISQKVEKKIKSEKKVKNSKKSQKKLMSSYRKLR